MKVKLVRNDKITKIRLDKELAIERLKIVRE